MTRRVAYLDCSTGVSGDKLLGALLDIGEASGEFTGDELRTLVAALAPEAHVEISRVLSHGVSAVSVNVSAEADPPHRHWSDIRALLEGASALQAPIRGAALQAFGALAEAEAAVHGTTVERVHFHEVGAIDSIVDIVGVYAGVHALGLKGAIVASPVAVGSGTVQTSHGVLPVPAPATASLLLGIPTVPGSAAGELTTPTGAVLVRTLAASFGEMPPMRAEQLGYGCGTRDIGMPNICRLTIGSALAVAPETAGESVALLECNLDHLAPEELAFVAQELLGAGAHDVWQTPIVMKKGRSAVMLSVLATPDTAAEFAERIIALTGSLGVRRQLLERTCVPREVREVATPWGPARVKVGAGRVRPEHDDVARIAREHALAYRAVAREIERLATTPDAIDER